MATSCGQLNRLSGVSERAKRAQEKKAWAEFKKGVDDYARRATHKLTRCPRSTLTVRQIVKEGA